MKRTPVYSIFATFLLLAACSPNKDTDKIAEAQACLDTATSATASTCADKVEGMETSAAYMIRCAAIFMQQGFNDPNKISAAMNNMDSGSGTSQTTQAMSALAFTAASTALENFNQAKTAVNYCTLSGSKGLTMLASIASISTSANYIKSITLACTGSDQAAALACLQSNGDSATKSAVGTAVISAYETNCTGANAGTNQEFCTQFQQATTAAGGTSNPEAVADKLLCQYMNNC